MGSCRIESPALFPPHLHSDSPYFFLSHPCLPFFLHSLVSSFSFEFIFCMQGSHMQTHRANTARHSADSYCFHLPQRWLSNELENTKQLHEKVWGYKQLPTVSIRSEMLPTFFRCRTIQTRYLKDRDSMPNPINKFDPLKGQNDKKNKTYRRQEICCVATGQLSWGSLGTESQTSSHRPPTSSYDTLQKHSRTQHLSKFHIYSYNYPLKHLVKVLLLDQKK